MSTESQRKANREWIARQRAADPEGYKEKAREAARMRRLLKPETIRGYDLKAKYGMTLADLDALRTKQGGQCAICSFDLRISGPAGDDREYVDHCHTTGKVRGLLCGRCNTSIGKFNDNPELLRKAARYVEHSQ